MHVLDLLRLMVKQNASDLFITADAPPSLKVDGRIMPVKAPQLDAVEARDLIYSIMNDRQRRDFEAHKECNFAVNPENVGRFRVNVFVQQGNVGMVARRINTSIPTFEQLRLPAAVMEEIAMNKRGLVIFVGGTGTGKSTTQAAMIGYRNEHTRGHIITIEDPIEFVHEHKNCIITHREVGVDTDSFKVALQNAMRQAPDVIQIGEVRTEETMQSAIVFSETGHLCLCTLHANNTYQALERILNLYPEGDKDRLLMDLSLNLRALISQRLIPVKDGKGRVASVEIMINSPLIADMIMKGDIDEIHDVIERSTEAGMQTFDQSLFSLYEQDLISYEDALRNAESVNNLRLKIKLESKDAKGKEHLGSSLKNVTY